MQKHNAVLTLSIALLFDSPPIYPGDYPSQLGLISR